MRRVASRRVGILIERRATGDRWQPWSWYPVAILPQGARTEPGMLLRQDDASALFYGGDRVIELHRTDTAGYKQNISMDRPVVFVVLRSLEGRPDHEAVQPFHVTVSPDEAQAYAEGDDAVFAVPMSPALVEWVGGFVAAHHEDQPFERRARTGGGAGAHGAAPEAHGGLVARQGWRVPGHD